MGKLKYTKLPPADFLLANFPIDDQSRFPAPEPATNMKLIAARSLTLLSLF